MSRARAKVQRIAELCVMVLIMAIVQPSFYKVHTLFVRIQKYVIFQDMVEPYNSEVMHDSSCVCDNSN